MYDVIVIGAGGGGAVMAKELCEQGLSVVLLEGGRANENTEALYSQFEGHGGNAVSGITRNGPSDMSRSAWFRELPQNSFIWDCSGVGGTTQAYFAACPRAQPGVFNHFIGDGRQYDEHVFPFSYEELVPYYEWVEATLPVAPAAMSDKEIPFLQGCKNIGLPLNNQIDITKDSYRPNPSAILQPGGISGKSDNDEELIYPQATGCTMCGNCNVGCPHPQQAPRNLKAKRSVHNSYIPMAKTTTGWSAQGKDLEIRADSYVVKILTNPVGVGINPKAYGVRIRNTLSGIEEDLLAQVVVLAAGAIESPRLWLRSELPNPNGWVGKGLTDHALDWVVGVYDHDINSTKGYASALRCDFPAKGGLIQVAMGPAFYGFTMGFSQSGVRHEYDNGTPKKHLYGAWDGPSGRIVGNELKAIFQDINKVSCTLVMTDDDVEKQNQVGLSNFIQDEHGFVARIKLAMRERSQRTLDNRYFTANKAAEIYRASGAKKVFRIDWPGLLLHMQSSMRMGVSEQNSVLQETGEARFVDALYIADNSALANGLGSSNPTLTTQALATRTAEKLAQKYFGVSPWVAIKEPISSVDEQVTAAVIAAEIT